MTTSRGIRWSIIALAALFGVVINAQCGCEPTPEKYRSLPFGDVRFAVEENCRQTFTQNEQFYLAGIAQHLRSICRLPRNPEGRELVERFVRAASSSLDLQKSHAPRQDGVTSQDDRASAFAAGASAMEDIPCNGPESALLARGIVIYLKHTPASSRFVTGCAELYAPRYAEKECRCIAGAIRPVFPDADECFFDRQLIKQAIHQSPRVALTLMLSCGASEY